MNVTCPTCQLPVSPRSAPSERTSAGTVRYARCLCGRWMVFLDDQPIAATNRSDFTEEATAA